MEEKISFKSGPYEMEGLADLDCREKGVVITHPHPLYGGDMQNPVVEAIVSAYRIKGYATLRFNFRGVGKSTGKYDRGIGEQEDVLAALTYLKEAGVKHLELAGYSFGTYVNAEAVRKGTAVDRMVMVSPPVGFMEFTEPQNLSCLELVVTGSRDDMAPPGLLYKILPRWNPECDIKVIEGADHFYSGCIKDLEALLASHL